MLSGDQIILNGRSFSCSQLSMYVLPWPDQIGYFYNVKEIINCVNGFFETLSQVTLGNTQNMVLTSVSTIYWAGYLNMSHDS
jgi:hypothetical protein